MSVSPERKARVEALVERILAATEQRTSHSSRRAVISAFTELGPEALDAIDDALVRLAGTVRNPERFVRSLVLTRNWDDEDDILRALLFADLFGEVPEDDVVLDFSKGVESYPEIFGWTVEASRLEGHDLLVARALVRLAHTIYEDLPEKESPLNDWMEEPRARFIEDKELVALVAEHADRIDEIVDLVLSRETADPAVVREYLQSPPALADGAL